MGKKRGNYLVFVEIIDPEQSRLFHDRISFIFEIIFISAEVVVIPNVTTVPSRTCWKKAPWKTPTSRCDNQTGYSPYSRSNHER